MTQAPARQSGRNDELALIKHDVIDTVAARVHELTGAGRLELPADYSVDNALTSWWLALQQARTKDNQPVLQVCTRDSIANATLDMVILGLNPARKQCYPVAFGKTLTCMPSYFGDEATLRRIYPGAQVYAEVVYVGDELEYEINRGRKTVTKHRQKFESTFGGIDSIAGAYVIIEFADGRDPHCEIMNIEQLKAAWARGENYPPKGDKMSAHHDHPEEFAKKTTIARACKRLINAADDSYLKRAAQRQAELAREASLEDDLAGQHDRQAITLPPKNEGPPAGRAQPRPAAQPKPERPAPEGEAPLPPHDPETGEIHDELPPEPTF